MIKEPKSMKEIHKIREVLYGTWAKMNDEAVVDAINKTTEEFLKKHNINLKTIPRTYPNPKKTATK